MIKQKQMQEIIETAAKFEKLGADVFIQLQGHVKWIEVSVHKNGWHGDPKMDFYKYAHYNGISYYKPAPNKAYKETVEDLIKEFKEYYNEVEREKEVERGKDES